MGFFDTLGNIGKSFVSGVSEFGQQAAKFNQAINPISVAVSAIGNLFDNKDSGQQNPFGGGGSAIQSSIAPPLVTTTTETGAGVFRGRGSALQSISGLNNAGSGGSLIQRPPFGNQNALIETNQSSVRPMGSNMALLNLPIQAGKVAYPYVMSGTSKALGLLGGLATTLIGDSDQSTSVNDNTTPFSDLITDYDISQSTGDFMAYGVGGQPLVQTQMNTGRAFFSPVLGRIGISSRGNIIITRRLKNQFKALADNVGLAQASNLAGIPLEIGAMILTKRFASKGKCISTKKMQDCARTYKRITHFYNMIPKRSATRTTRAKTMRGSSTVIQNS